jgi:hypothetical protein
MGYKEGVSSAPAKDEGKCTYSDNPPPIIVSPQQLVVAESPQSKTRSEVAGGVDGVARDPALWIERSEQRRTFGEGRGDGEGDSPYSCLVHRL